MQKIDHEVRRIVDESYARATKILEDNRDILDSMTQALMKYETISSDQIDELMERKPVSDPVDWGKTTVDVSKKKNSKVSSISVARNEKTDPQAEDLSQDIAATDTPASDDVVDGNDSAQDKGVRVDVSKKKPDDADDEPTSIS